MDLVLMSKSVKINSNKGKSTAQHEFHAQQVEEREREGDKRPVGTFEFNRFSSAPNFKIQKCALPDLQNL
jgi:hypothetical protein